MTTDRENDARVAREVMGLDVRLSANPHEYRNGQPWKPVEHYSTDDAEKWRAAMKGDAGKVGEHIKKNLERYGFSDQCERIDKLVALASRPTGFTAEQVMQMAAGAWGKFFDSHEYLAALRHRLASAKPEPVKVIDGTGKSYEECRKLINAMHGGPVEQISGVHGESPMSGSPPLRGSSAPSPDSTIDVGAGFYRLAVGTVLQEGDEWTPDREILEWRKFERRFIGEPFMGGDYDVPIYARRKLPAPAPRVRQLVQIEDAATKQPLFVRHDDPRVPAQPSQASTLKPSAEAEKLIREMEGVNFAQGRLSTESPGGIVYRRKAQEADVASGTMRAFIATLESAAATWEKLAVDLVGELRKYSHVTSIKSVLADQKSIIARIDAARKEQSNG